MPDDHEVDRIELGRRLYAVSYTEGEFALSAGGVSSYYLDKFQFATRPELLRAVAVELAARVPAATTRLAAPVLGAVPFGTAVSLETGLPLVIVRKEPKAYGAQRQFEGVLEPGDEVTIVEDIVTTGSESLRTARAVRAAGADVVAIVAIIDREQGGAQNIADAGFPFTTLFVQSEIQPSAVAS